MTNAVSAMDVSLLAVNHAAVDDADTSTQSSPVSESESKLANDEATPGRIQQVIDTMRDVSTVAKVLRFLGAAAVVGSLSVFLLQGWDQGNDAYRYFLLLGQTLLMTLAGFAMSYALKENKGARVFFGLSLVSIPANFAILGALLLSIVQWDSALIDVPAFATWSLAGATTVIGTFAIAFIVLVPVSYFGLSIMARRSAGKLLIPFLVLNAAMLIPVRISLYAGPIALFALIVALLVITRLMKQDSTLRTAEGRFACLLLMVPSVLMLIRTASLYQPDTMLLMLIATTVYVTLRHIALQLNSDSRMRRWLESLGVLSAIVTAACVTDLSTDWLSAFYAIPVFAVTLSGLLLETAYRSQRSGLAYCRFAGFVITLGFFTNMIVFATVITAMMCFFAGLAITVFGFAIKDRVTTFFGVIAAVGGVANLVYFAIEYIHMFGWMSLAVFGVVTIVFGSVLDLHGARIKLSNAGWIATLSSRPSNQSVGDTATQESS